MRLWIRLLAVMLVAAGCARGLPSAPSLPPPPPAPAPGYYTPPGEVPAPLSTECVSESRWQTVRRVRLPMRLPPEVADLSHADDPLEILLYAPRPALGRRPVVLMAPVLANSTLLMNEFASAFTRQGWIAAVVLRKEFDFRPADALAEAEGEFRTYVLQQRQALDWLVEQPDVDAGRVATFGISAGAVIGACTAAVDPRPVAHVLVLAGGPLADVLAETRERRFVDYRAALQAAGGESGDALRRRLRATLRTDPVALAPRIDPASVLLFVARHDTSVPTRYGVALWQAMGRPRLAVLPFGHKTSFVLLPWITHEAVRFIGARFATA